MIVGVGEGVGDAVEVGAHPQAVELVVVAGVDDGSDRRGIHDVDETTEEPGCTDTAGEGSEHGGDVSPRAGNGSGRA
jgi:hypothetical protein